MFQDKIVKAILLMAGQGTRFSATSLKQFHKLGGKALYLHTLEEMIKNPFIDEVILVVSFELMENVRNETSHYTEKPLHIVRGGNQRQSSSWQGLLAAGPNSDIVLIHDGVRPFVTQEILNANIEKALEHRAVNTCIPTFDTMNIVGQEGFVEIIPDRSKFLRGQTPQTFDYQTIVNAHLEAQNRNKLDMTDDCSLVLLLGIHPFIVMGSENNIKITTELDFFLAEQLLYLKKEELKPHSLGALAGKTFIVVGGTGGIGKAVTEALEKTGAKSIIVSRSSKEWPCDVTKVEEVKKVFSLIGQVDGIINSMGYLQVSALKHLDDEQIASQINVNLTSAFYLCKYAPLKSGGHIVNIASSSYSRGRKEYTIYSAAKSGLVNFTLGLAEERSDLYVNAIVPQRTRTKMRTSNFPLEEDSLLLSPEQVAAEVLQLLAAQISGRVISINHKPTLKQPLEPVSSED
jgi:2-C-methyl-D-erythritol 4-phosphate cytidylyltransferase